MWKTHLTLYRPLAASADIGPTPSPLVPLPLWNDTSGKPLADLNEFLRLGRSAGGSGALLGLGEGVAGVLLPPVLPLGGQGVDRVVVLVGAVQRLRVLLLDPGPVVLLPVGDAAHLVVLAELVHPALPDVRDVADDAGGRESRQIAEDAVLQVLRDLHGHPPVLDRKS